jgi:hypothetical protein
MNKGTGAGGSNTTKNGNTFELLTSIEYKLITEQFIKKFINKKNKYGYYFEKTYKLIKIVYFKQNGLKLYFKHHFNIDIYKNPDEAFLIYDCDRYFLKILEKKHQNMNGSIEDKLKTGAFNRREYELMINDNKFIVEYAFCVNSFLQKKLNSKVAKYINMRKIMKEDNIKLFYGHDKHYINKLYRWINH